MYLGRVEGWQYWAFVRVDLEGQVRLYLYRKGPGSRWKTEYMGVFEPQRLTLYLKRLGLWAGVRALASVFSRVLRLTKRKAVYLDREALEEARRELAPELKRAREELEERVRRYVKRNELVLQDIAMAAKEKGLDPYEAVYERVLKYALEAAEELGLTEEDARRATERALWA
ncbi:hypothetical protein [Pyrobaculum aerophilum]|uniref:Uncharacterized protein n=1 Tax=Pyrobaculum aerophilum TaxID=13773 RepID=A0A371R418_9CREN|nr:hypothetical protein [Pyrobaculum aerophilum]RFA98507.1 hypothetical protein CGL51_00250 [Pyrobaculum aerophilum]RFB00001.1 hypothetical protein CGL52_02220 [Pyrobaculum aerophilum]